MTSAAKRRDRFVRAINASTAIGADEALAMIEERDALVYALVYQGSEAVTTASKRERELIEDVRERLLDISEGLASEVSLEPEEAEVLLNRFFTVEAVRRG